MQSPENAWLAREQVVLNQLKATAGVFRWGFWMMRLLLPAVTLIALVGAVLKRSLKYLTVGLVLIAPTVRIFKQKFNSDYARASEEVAAAMDAVRRGASGSFPPEYSPETQRLREPLLGDVGGQLAIQAAFLLFCGAAFIATAIFLMALMLMDEGFSLLFWGLSPVYILFWGMGLPLGAMGVTCARSAWAVRKQSGESHALR